MIDNAIVLFPDGDNEILVKYNKKVQNPEFALIAADDDNGKIVKVEKIVVFDDTEIDEAERTMSTKIPYHDMVEKLVKAFPEHNIFWGVFSKRDNYYDLLDYGPVYFMDPNSVFEGINEFGKQFQEMSEEIQKRGTEENKKTNEEYAKVAEALRKGPSKPS